MREDVLHSAGSGEISRSAPIVESRIWTHDGTQMASPPSLAEDACAAFRKRQAVLVGRRANFMLHGADDGIPIPIRADQDIRIQRMAKARNTNPENAGRKLQQMDKERRDFILQHFRQAPDDPSFYDAVFRTDILSVQEVADAVLALLRGFGERHSGPRRQ